MLTIFGTREAENRNDGEREREREKERESLSGEMTWDEGYLKI